jgi:hypothetical protein
MNQNELRVWGTIIEKRKIEHSNKLRENFILEMEKQDEILASEMRETFETELNDPESRFGKHNRLLNDADIKKALYDGKGAFYRRMVRRVIKE